MPLAIGARLGPYAIVAPIGKGGMGEVYRARDTKLGRDVAIKVLPGAFAQDGERLARFEREAKLLASLNHPNIASIFGFEESESVKAIVLELVDGPTLAERIREGPLPVEETMAIARQIADALEAGHAADIIHRDLKPANVKLKDDGTVKLLDYGLAKALVDESESGSAESNLSQSPTLTRGGTQLGVILGTAAYMSPEQAKGKRVDRRADVWAFGAVVYEMLTGKQAFGGEDVPETLASVLGKEPDWEALPAGTPGALRRVLRLCLTKDAKARVRDIADVRLAMSGAFESAEERPELALWQRPLPALAAAIGIAIVAGLAVSALEEPELASRSGPKTPVRFSLVLPESAPFRTFNNITSSAFSPDGNEIVYTTETGSGPELYRRPFHQLTSEPLPGASGSGPFFSPDGEWLGFLSRNARTILKVPRAGGTALAIAESPMGIRGAHWGRDGQIIFGTVLSGLYRVPASGGEPEALTTPDEAREETSHRWPFHIPGTATVLFNTAKGRGGFTAVATGELEALDLETGAISMLGLAGVHPRYLPTGHLVYVTEDPTVTGGGNLLAVPFDPVSLEYSGTPVPVIRSMALHSSGAAHFKLSDNGRLVVASVPERAYSRGKWVWVDRNGREETVADPPGGPHLYENVAVSPGGGTLAMSLGGRYERRGVWSYDLARHTLSPVAVGDDVMGSPLWTPDGRRVVFSSIRDASWGLRQKNADGTGEDEILITADDASRLVAVSWAGPNDDATAALLAMKLGSQLEFRLLLLSVRDRTVQEFPIDAAGLDASLSPDGEWLAYSSARSGRREIYIERFPNLSDRLVVSNEGGEQPLWSNDGRELYYLDTEKNRVMMVAVASSDSPTGVDLAAPEVLAERPVIAFDGGDIGHSYDVASDGRLLLLTPGDAEAPLVFEITVVLDWFDELKRLVPIPE